MKLDEFWGYGGRKPGLPEPKTKKISSKGFWVNTQTKATQKHITAMLSKLSKKDDCTLVCDHSLVIF